MKITLPKSLAVTSLALASAAIPISSLAQALEEVVVTATKRSVGMQDVPIALSVMSGDTITSLGLRDMEDVSVYMPNVTLSQAAGASQIFIRGVGSGNNFGFEQSVGMFIDGVYFGRDRNARAAFLDVERVEVLKGPQSTLFGKNTVGGAINITTVRPSEQFEGFVQASYVDELNGMSLIGGVSGPLSDSVRGRLVAKVYESDGFMTNTAPGGNDGPQREDSVIRGSLEWDASENLSVFMKAERGRFDVLGRNYKITTSTPTSTFLYGLGDDPNFADSLGFNHKQSVSGLPGRADFDNNDSDIFQLDVEYQMGGHSLRSITAYTDYQFNNCVDADYSSLAFLDRCRDESHEQFTQEFIFTSSTGGSVEYLAGVFYQNATLQSDASTMLNWSALPPIESAILNLVGGLPAGAINSEFLNNFGQDTTTWSAFAEVTFNISDAFRTIVGVRYSDDSKDAEKTQITTVPGTGVSSPLLAAVNGSGGLGFAVEYDYKENRNEEHWTGNINLQYDLDNDVMTYLNLSNGYKAGGYDADNAMDRSREFDDETVTSLEFGIKAELWNNRARFNTAIFLTDFSDLQVSGFESAGFVVGNAAESEVRGVEMDFVIAATDELTFTGAWAYLDSTYKSYAKAACTVYQQTDGTCAANGRFQDLSGATLQFAPQWAGNLSVDYVRPLTAGIDFRGRLDALYSDDVSIAPDGDPNVIQESYWKFNAIVAIESQNDTWSVALVGKNLTDETTFNWGNDATLAGLGFGFEYAYFHIIEAPRTLELQVRLNF